MVTHPVARFVARSSSYKIISPWETIRTFVSFNNVKGFTENAKNSDRQRFAFPSPSWIWRVRCAETNKLVNFTRATTAQMTAYNETKQTELTTNSELSIRAQFNG